MLSKDRRISRKTYPTYRPSNSLRGEYSSIYIFDWVGNSKFSFLIPKKVGQSAVIRNEFRRLGYRTVYKHLPAISKGHLVKFKINVLPKDKSLFVKDIEDLLAKTGIMDK